MDTILFFFFINILALSNIKHYTVKLLCIVGPRYLFGTKQIYIYIKRVFGPYVQFCFCFFFNHFLLTAWWWDNKKFTINISGSESITNSQKAWNQYGVIKGPANGRPIFCTAALAHAFSEGTIMLERRILDIREVTKCGTWHSTLMPLDLSS